MTEIQKGVPLFTIHLDPLQAIYTPGEEIRGFVQTDFPDKIIFKKLTIKCQGIKTTLQVLGRDLTANLTEPFLDIKKEIQASSDVYEVKKHQFEFVFKLPNNLPSSWIVHPNLKAPSCIQHYQASQLASYPFKIDYAIEAHMEDFQMPGKFEQDISMTTKYSFMVREIVPEKYSTIRNHMRTMYQGVIGVTHTYEATMTGVTPSSSFSCLSQPKRVIVSAILAKNVFTHGEKIKLQINVTNESNYQFAVMYGVHRVFKYHRAIDKQDVEATELFQPEMLPGIPAAINISKKGINLLNGNAEIEMETKELTNFDLQPSIGNSEKIEVNDSILLQLVWINKRKSRILETLQLPIYINSSGMSIHDVGGPQVLPVDVNIKTMDEEYLQRVMKYMMAAQTRITIKPRSSLELLRAIAKM